METFSAEPLASTLIESLRDIGYTLDTAIADIVDNSITAGARSIEILTHTSSDGIKLGIADDGTGMSFEELKYAMRPGSKVTCRGRHLCLGKGDDVTPHGL